MAVSLPVLNKIQNKELSLINYKLTSGICAGIGNACKAQPKLIQSIILIDNGCSDSDFSKLLSGLVDLEHCKTIIYKMNIFSNLSLTALRPILHKRRPCNLEELRIVQCRINSAVTHDLITALTESSSLKRLGLVQVSFSNSSFSQLCDYIRDARSLIDLDLSYNELRPLQMFKLLEVISKDRKIINLDLSWNMI